MVVVPRHPNGVEKHLVGNSFPRSPIAKEVGAWLQLHYSPTYEEVGEDVAAPELSVQDKIVAEY
jgi:hypothetical protein